MPTLKVKTLNAHLTRKNSKYPPQKSQAKLPTLKVKTLSAHPMVKTLNAHLKGENLSAHLTRGQNLSTHLKSQNPKCPP